MADITEPSRSGTITEDGTQWLSAVGALQNAAFNTLYLEGDFGGGSVDVEVSPDDGVTWFLMANMTAKGFINFQIRFEKVRIKLKNSTNPDLNYWVV